ncbi:hypothetical protein MLD38_034522 [Melastoma candidum]|uniref:Uncharacterized protein n=1 Tax=Melastoma candidum TaxID=119954 RepID=A0ACB9MA59_9MYRT|nr:hypothetical protein MLD38_034522 [Melastoma candidum]
MVSLGGSGGEVLAAAKTYYCKICGKSFSSGRVLGGHVRGHQASAGSAARKMTSPVLAEGSESHSCLTDRAGDSGGGCHLGKSAKSSGESFGTGEQKIDSWNSENRCGQCGKGFGSRKALFGHLRIHSGSKQRVKGRSDRRDPSPVVQVSSVVILSRNSAVQEALSECEIVSPAMRRKRSLHVTCSGNEPINNAFPNFSEDENKAAVGLLMISKGVESWKYSGDVKNSSGFLQIGNGVQVLDVLHPGVGNKRRFGEVDDAAPKKLTLTGYDSFVIDSNVKGEDTECQTGSDMTSGGIELQSFVASSMVEKMRSLTVDVLEGEKLSALSSDDELGGGNGERMIPDTRCRRSVLTFKRRGYKCRSCHVTFPTHLQLGKHCMMSCCSLLNPEKTGDMKVNGEGASSPSNANCCDTGMSVDGVGGQSLSGPYWSHVHGVPLPDLNIPLEALLFE